MSIKWPLSKSMGGSVTIHNCRFTDEPIILCEGDDEIIVVMDSRVFARAYGFTTSHYDMQYIFEAEGMDVHLTASQLKKTATLIDTCNKVSKPVVVSKYGWDVVVAMSPTEFEKRQHLF